MAFAGAFIPVEYDSDLAQEAVAIGMCDKLL
jgi:hypothetical protein